ncbi:MAG: type II toxin-antitoxin system HicA family toxin [Euryarchaeota archaeon]|nr:type II toxin-antitoxin system HicA family toxin [Euryarchaeota archaeon]
MGVELAREKERMLKWLENNPKNIRFIELCRAAEVFGFQGRGGKGSHRIFVKEGIPEMLNFQNVKGKAKPYQVRQLIKVIKKYNLEK